MAEAITLKDSFQAAVQQSERLSIQEENINQAEEKYRQAVGAVLPNASAGASYFWQDDQETVRPGAQPASTRQPLLKLSATQPIFRGFREWIALRSSKQNTEAERQVRRQVLDQLKIDVARSFFAILTYEKDVENLMKQKKIYEKRVKSLRERTRIGKSQSFDTLQVEAAVAKLEAEILEIQGRLAAEREAFRFLTGQESNVVLENSSVSFSTAGLNAEAALSRLTERPDVRAEKERLLIAEQGVSSERGALLPDVDLTGNYYPYRSGSLADVKWDLQLAATLPLFSGGALISRIREATSRKRQAEMNHQAVVRAAEQEIKSLLALISASQKQAEALRAAVDLSERSYRDQEKQYDLGLVSNLDVLIALTTYEENLRGLSRADYSLQLQYLQFQVATAQETL